MTNTKMIRLSEEVHEKVAKIADSNYRGMGDQVAYWADHTCTHPRENRVEVDIVVAEVTQATKKQVAQVGKGQPVRGFFCSMCHQYVFADLPSEVSSAISKPIATAK